MASTHAQTVNRLWGAKTLRTGDNPRTGDSTDRGRGDLGFTAWVEWMRYHYKNLSNPRYCAR